MAYGILADLVFLLHLCFVLYVAFGGLLTMRWPRSRWLHLPALAWAAVVEFTGWVCPLTPLEWWLRRLAGQRVPGGGFLETYLYPVLYPEGLTRADQYLLGVGLVLLNLIVYGFAWRKARVGKRNV